MFFLIKIKNKKIQCNSGVKLALSVCKCPVSDLFFVFTNAVSDLLYSFNTLLSSPRVLRPPGGGASNIFGGGDSEPAASSKPHKMASNVFAAPEPTESVQKRTNPPGQGQTDIESRVLHLGCNNMLCNTCYPRH